jgi:hypothetical protein
MLARQPGVALLWVTRAFRVVPVQARPDEGIRPGVLFEMGDPVETVWLREGRPATRAEVEASIDSGYPSLLAMAEADGPEGVAELTRARAAVTALLPTDDEGGNGPHA